MRRLRIALVISSLVLVVGLSAQSSDRQYVRLAPTGLGPVSAAVTVGGIVYVSGIMATNMQGAITAQTEQVFEVLRGVLAQADSSLDNIAHVNVFLQRPFQDLAAFDEAYRNHFTGDLPARTVMASNLTRLGALVEMQVTAIPNGGERRVITPSGWRQDPNYSYAIQSGDTLFMSSMKPRDNRDFSPAPPVDSSDPSPHVTVAMANASEVLEAAGMTIHDAVTSRVLVRDGSQPLNNNMNATYSAHWHPEPALGGKPARMRYRGGLPERERYEFEVTFVAVKGESPREVVMPPGRSEGGCCPPAIKVGNRLWISGGTGHTEENAGDVRAQTTENMARLASVLKYAEFSFEDVVHVEVELTNPSVIDGHNDALLSIFPFNPPIRTLWGVPSLNHPDALIEMGLMAVRPAR